MRLSDFILTEMQAIIAEWESFAATQLPAAQSMSRLALRDHAEQILGAIAHDLTQYQSAEAQLEKSHGRVLQSAIAPRTAAQTHAILRARAGFDINQLGAEYRALRASVLRLWLSACTGDVLHQGDIIRFNEAIDQALAESIEFFSVQVEQSRNLLLGMLGHDMRGPLQSIQMTAYYLTQLNAGSDISAAAARLIVSGSRMKALLEDLVDFNRAQLGLGIAINPATSELADCFVNELELLRGAYPNRLIEFDCRASDTSGQWDALRLQQVLCNLVMNALKYGARDTPVRVVLTTGGDKLIFAVKNVGPMIDPVALGQIFDPLSRGYGLDSTDAEGSLGLGLYIASEIVRAHRGVIAVSSSTAETAFTVTLPRQ